MDPITCGLPDEPDMFSNRHLKGISDTYVEDVIWIKSVHEKRKKALSLVK
jgi:hypothetical protein